MTDKTEEQTYLERIAHLEAVVKQELSLAKSIVELVKFRESNEDALLKWKGVVNEDKENDHED